MKTKISLYVAVILIFLSGILITFTEGQIYYLPLLLSGIALLVGIFFAKSIYNPSEKIYIDTRYFIISILFLSSNLVSTIVNGEGELILSSFQHFIVFLTLSVFIVNFDIKLEIKQITYIYILIHIVFLLIGTIQNLPLTYPYYAIFDNPNTLGVLAAGVFALSIAIIMTSKVKHLVVVLLIMTVTFSFILIVYSGSRTSLFTIIAVVLSLIIFNQVKVFINVKKSVINFFLNIIKWPIIITVTLMIIYFAFESTLNVTILDKINRKAASGDFLSYRSYVWVNTIKEAKLFGRGSGYFVENYGVGAHNTFISILGQFGIVSTILFITLIIFFLIDSIKYFFKNLNSNFSLLPFVVILSFIMLSLAEIMLMKSIMFLMFILIGVVSKSISYQKQGGFK